MGYLDPVMERPSWPEYALRLAETAATRSEDPYQKVGACVLRHDNSVAALGYNGAPPGITIDWTNRDQRRKFVVHAEVNCLRYIKPGEGMLLAATLLPCSECIKHLASYGIKEVYFREFYDKDRGALEVAPVFGVTLTQLFS
jgi:dCMP deaminase